jgi:hypothetical protein
MGVSTGERERAVLDRATVAVATPTPNGRRFPSRAGLPRHLADDALRRRMLPPTAPPWSAPS